VKVRDVKGSDDVAPVAVSGGGVASICEHNRLSACTSVRVCTCSRIHVCCEATK